MDVFLVGALCAAPRALADVLGDDVDVFAAMSYLADDNLFRREADVHREERARLLAGVRGEVPLGLQELRFNLAAHANRFAEAEELDYTGGSADAALDWKIGTRFDGAITYEYRRDLTNFESLRTITKDITAYDEADASAGYWLTSRTRLRGTVRRSGWRHSSPAWRTTELDETEYGADVLFRTRPGTMIGFGTARIDGDYLHREYRPGGVDNAYEQINPALVVEWRPESKTALDVRLGRTSRTQEHASERDFRATTGELELEYAFSRKTNLTLSYAREIRSIDEAVARAALVDTLEVAPAWYASRNVAIGARLTYQKQDFLPLEGFAEGERIDEELHVETRVFYTLRRRLSVELGIGRGYRQSTEPGLDYDYLFGSIGLRVQL